MAKTMGSILDDPQVVNVDAQQWYVSHLSSARFGQAIPLEIVGDVVALGQHGVVQWDGMMRLNMSGSWQPRRLTVSRRAKRIHWEMPDFLVSQGPAGAQTYVLARFLGPYVRGEIR